MSFKNEKIRTRGWRGQRVGGFFQIMYKAPERHPTDENKLSIRKETNLNSDEEDSEYYKRILSHLKNTW